MTLLVWSTDKESKVRSSLGQVTKAHADIPLVVTDDFTAIPEGTRGIFCLGNDAKDAVAALGVVPKNRTITSLRHRKWALPSGVPVLFSYSPGIYEVDYGKYVDLLTDTAAMYRVLKTGQYEPVTGQYRYVTDFAETIARAKQVHAETGKPVPAELDLETVGLDPWAQPDTVAPGHPGGYIVSIQVTVEAGKSDVLYFKSRATMRDWFDDFEHLQQISWLLNAPELSLGGANLKYDLIWLWVQAALECTNFRFDTTLVGSLLDENRSNGLDVHAKLYSNMAGYSDTFDKTVDKSRMDRVPPEKLLPYAGGDTDACHQVRQAMTPQLLADKKLAGFYINILHPAARAFEQVERGGVCVDKQAFDELEADLNTEVVRLVKDAAKVVGGRIALKHADADKPGGLNLTKASFITDFMFSPMGLNLKPRMTTEKTGAPSTALDHLLLFQDVPEAKAFVALQKEYASATKTLGTYVVGFRKHLRSDGRFHPSYWFFAGNKDEDEGGTVTGRLSCKDPAYQTIPKHTKWAKRIRRCYIAPPGYQVAEIDYSQGELKIMACIANEPSMLQAYLDGMDLHALTSGRFAGYTYEEMMQMKGSADKALVDLFEAIRQLGKAGNFGLIYGMQAEGFYNYAVSNYGVKDFTLAQAAAFRESFFAQYPVLLDYHEQYKRRAKTFGFVQGPLGRIRHLPLIGSPNREVRSKAERQAINSPVQGTLSDMMLWAIALSVKQGWQDEMPCFGVCHDAGNWYVPEDRLDECVARQLDLMENLPFHQVGWAPQLQFTADAKVGPNLADLAKFKPKLALAA